MLYPNFLNKGSIIGITAPSAGVGDSIESFERSLKTLKNQEYKIIETKSVRNKGITSTTGQQRAKELDELIENKKINIIICANGGDFLMEMLPYINWDHIKEKPKWLMGYSDPTALLYIVTTKLDIASIYGYNALSFNQTNPHESLQNNLKILSGNIIEQHSFELHQKDWLEETDGYNLTEKVFWETINGEVNIQGRMIGGCLDCLKDIIGTSFDYTKNFIEKYKKDGIIWYFDVCELSVEVFYRTLFQMKEVGWFKYITGLIVGRVAMPKCFYNDFTYQDAIKKVFPNLPTIFNADIGHVAPKMTIINGSIAHIICKNGKGVIKQTL